jgi:hypothetical protein
MEIKRGGTQASRKGPAGNFTGSVRIDPLFDPPEPARTYGAMVTFEPGARAAWHTHPLGPLLAGAGDPLAKDLFAVRLSEGLHLHIQGLVPSRHSCVADVHIVLPTDRRIISCKRKNFCARV